MQKLEAEQGPGDWRGREEFRIKERKNKTKNSWLFFQVK